LVSGYERALRSLSAQVAVSVVGTVGGSGLLVEGALELSLAELSRAHGALAELFA
jgi:hypothetical protein